MQNRPFLSVMGHEFRTPLNAILGFSEVMIQRLKDGKTGPKDLGYLDQIHDAGQRLHRLVENILELVALTDSGASTRHMETETDLLVQNVVRQVSERAAAQGLRIETDLARAPVRLDVDGDRLMRCLSNLLDNAVKFTPAGGTVQVVVDRTEAGEVRVTVRDTGCGMDEEGIAKALSLFEQVDSGLARRYEGAGLGLPLAWMQTKSMGGLLDVESAVGKGTVVTITLPSKSVSSSVPDTEPS